MKISDILYYARQGFKLAKINADGFNARFNICAMIIASYLIDCLIDLYYFWNNYSREEVLNVLFVSVMFIPFLISIILDICWYAINDTVNRYTLKPHAVSDNVKKCISSIRNIMTFVLVLSIFVSIAIGFYRLQH